MVAAVAHEPADDEALLYTLIGSQFGAKVVAALDACRVPYRIVEVDIMKMKQQLAPPHTVPQMRWRGELLTDSADILAAIDRFVDAAAAPFKLYPTPQKTLIEELEQYCGTTLNGYIIYFTWWVEEGFAASYERKMVEYNTVLSILPLWLARRILPWLVDTGRMRGAQRKKARTILGDALIPPGRTPEPEEATRMRASLVEVVRALDARFATAAQQWLCATDHPSAADFAAYGILERLVGNEGDANMGSAAPWLFGEAQAERLRSWHARMVAAYPIRFNGKTANCQVWAKL